MSAYTPSVGHDAVPGERPAVASWYTQGRSDGIGDRLLMSDDTGTALELLRFRPEIALTYGFERALRERVERLDDFRHTAFPRVHAVEYLEQDDGLALASAHTPGKRLSELFQPGRLRGGVHPAFATWLVRHLTSAIADLQAQGPRVSHGAITSDRIVVTPDGRLVIVEHVLGSALACLDLPAGRLWTDLGIIGVPEAAGQVWLDRRGDVVQIGLITLSTLLGRRVTPRDYPQHLPSLLDEFAEVAQAHAPGVIQPLRIWLEQALRTDGQGFKSARDAQGGLARLAEGAGPRGATEPAHFLNRTFGPRTMPSSQPFQSTAAGDPFPRARFESGDAAPSVELGTAPSIGVRTESEPRKTSPRLFSKIAPTLAVAFAIVAVAEAVGLTMLIRNRPSALAPVAVPLRVDSSDSGDVVMVDGVQAGVTPLEMKAGAATRSIRVVHVDRLSPEVRTALETPSVPVTPAGKPATGALAAIAQAAARQRSGGLKLVTPIEIQVLEGDRVLGTSAEGPIVAAAGDHDLELVNNPFGYKARQRVTIKAGEIITVTVAPPNGRVSVNAVPWAQVWLDGKPLGETPLANISVPVGDHEIVFRHPQLGEQRMAAIVRSGALTRVSASLGQ